MSDRLLVRQTTSSHAPQRTVVRTDIQALRALAVLLVVVYHFFPSRLSGGFVGVDVFFVISGFLITQHLLTSPPRTFGDLARFWGRRIRRLLPASLLVLAVSLVATIVFAPATVWENTARQVTASALYVQNWFLAAEAVDYLAADTAVSPVQHFWSLSIEEQFYLVWPILVLLAAAFAARGAKRLSVVVGVVVAVLVAASLGVSIVLTAQDPAAAYFVTWTRVWELGAGGLAACLYAAVQRLLGRAVLVRTVAAWAGLAMIAVSAVQYSSATPFPGSAAALPVAGTVLVLLATVERGPLSPAAAMAWRPVQVTGDVSYSLYLWHWPVVVLLPAALGDVDGWVKLVAIVLVFGLSWLTKIHVEDRFRGRRPLGEPLRRSFVFALVGMLVVGGGAAGVAAALVAEREAQQDRVAAAAEEAARCYGGAALVESGCDPHGEELITTPEFAKADKPDPYQDGCWILRPYDDHKTCHYGSDDPDAVQVALVGNSHAGHWLPALQAIAERRNWSITTYLISVCYSVDVPLAFTDPQERDNCSAWNDFMIDDIADGGYDLVVASSRTNLAIDGLTAEATDAAAEEAYGRVLDRWSANGTPVLVLHDTPYATDLENVPDCVAANLDDLSACDGDTTRIEPDPLAWAAEGRSERIDMLDLTSRICRDETCYSVIGGVIVYFDTGHLSGTFAESLSPEIESAAVRLLRVGDDE